MNSEQIIRLKTDQQLRDAIAKAQAGVALIDAMQQSDYENVGHPNLEMSPSKQGIAICESVDARMVSLYRLGIQMCRTELARRGRAI